MQTQAVSTNFLTDRWTVQRFVIILGFGIAAIMLAAKIKGLI